MYSITERICFTLRGVQHYMKPPVLTSVPSILSPPAWAFVRVQAHAFHYKGYFADPTPFSILYNPFRQPSSYSELPCLFHFFHPSSLFHRSCPFFSDAISCLHCLSIATVASIRPTPILHTFFGGILTHVTPSMVLHSSRFGTSDVPTNAVVSSVPILPMYSISMPFAISLLVSFSFGRVP